MVLRTRFAYAGIRVRSLARSLRFYRRLGFHQGARGKMTHGGQWVHLASPGGRLVLELNYYPKGTRFYEPYRPGSEMDHLGFFVDDVEGWLRRAARAGAERHVEWTESGWRLAYVRDPDGIWLEFIGRVRPPALRTIRIFPRRRRRKRSVRGPTVRSRGPRSDSRGRTVRQSSEDRGSRP